MLKELVIVTAALMLMQLVTHTDSCGVLRIKVIRGKVRKLNLVDIVFKQMKIIAVIYST